MSANTNTTRTAKLSSTVAKTATGGSKACSPFKPNSNTNAAVTRKPAGGLKVVTASTNAGVGAAPSVSVSVSSNGGGSNATPSVAPAAYSSDEENVRPAPPLPSSGAAAQGPAHGQEQAPLSPQVKEFSRERERDVRAYEHERQRAKRAGEWAVRRARKAGVGAMAPVAGAGAGAGVGAGGRKTRGNREREEEVDGEYVVGGRVPGVGFPSVLARAADDGVHKVVRRSTAIVTPKVNVRLEELVVPSRSKSKVPTLGLSTKGLVDDEEFEWVPAPRAVIALDEVEFGNGRRDMEVDEPWECVDKEAEGAGGDALKRVSSKTQKELSYAAVLTRMHVE